MNQQVSKFTKIAAGLDFFFTAWFKLDIPYPKLLKSSVCWQYFQFQFLYSPLLKLGFESIKTKEVIVNPSKITFIFQYKIKCL